MKKYHVCPKCGKKWRCHSCDLCSAWKTTNCKCDDCAPSHIMEKCKEAQLIWSVS